MGKKDLKELAKKTISELKSLLAQKKKDLVLASLSVLSGKEKNVKKAKLIRLEIAQISTIIREKEFLDEDSLSGKK
ncbi:MAG: 50S ribosomal protein L29 [Patescibacteria group bacterium]|nr:50S ribosomal protein L29 [Patescibacteria group bacterium]MCX7928557.1 50S ribosomal protein L29 [Patescibacteria group bacterium]